MLSRRGAVVGGAAGPPTPWRAWVVFGAAGLPGGAGVVAAGAAGVIAAFRIFFAFSNSVR